MRARIKEAQRALENAGFVMICSVVADTPSASGIFYRSPRGDEVRLSAATIGEVEEFLCRHPNRR